MVLRVNFVAKKPQIVLFLLMALLLFLFFKDFLFTPIQFAWNFTTFCMGLKFDLMRTKKFFLWFGANKYWEIRAIFQKTDVFSESFKDVLISQLHKFGEKSRE